MKQVGIIGVGNMGGALLECIVKSGYSVIAYDKNESKKTRIKASGGISAIDENEVASSADLLIIAVKPKDIDTLLDRIYTVLNKDCIIVSIAAGVGFEQIYNIVGTNAKVALAMPNMPAIISKGVSGLVFGENLIQDEKKYVSDVFSCCGTAVEIKSEQLPAFVGIAGSLPAYVFMMVEAIADAGVAEGIDRATALKVASAAVAGSAAMISDTNTHPALLKDSICSPLGTTVEAVFQLEKLGFRSAVIEAVRAAAKKTRRMGRKSNLNRGGK